MAESLLPCPFCGSTNISAAEGSTFRWWVASCNECGAQAGEARRQTLGEGSNAKWDAAAKDAALKEWNTRAALDKSSFAHFVEEQEGNGPDAPSVGGKEGDGLSKVLGFLAYQTADDDRPVFFPTLTHLNAGVARWYPPVQRVVPVGQIEFSASREGAEG